MAEFLGGFSPLRYRSGAPWNGAVHVYTAGSDMFPGDMVILKAGAAIPTAAVGTVKTYLKNVTVSTGGATESLVGVVVGFAPNPLDLNTTVGSTAPISSGMQVFVADDPELIFGGVLSGTGDFTVADIGLNTIVNVATAGANGRSGQLVDASFGNAAAAALRCVGIVDSPDNSITGGGTYLEVVINNHAYKSATGVVGV